MLMESLSGVAIKGDYYVYYMAGRDNSRYKMILNDYQKTFLDTFSPTIVRDIITLVDNDVLSHTIGRKLLYAYIDTHKTLLTHIDQNVLSEFDWKDVFDYNFTIQFGDTYGFNR